MQPRGFVLASVAVVGLTSGLAHADAPATDEDVAFLGALGKPGASSLTQAIGLPFLYDGLSFRSASCTKTFAAKGTVATKAQLAPFVACLAQLDVPTGKGSGRIRKDTDSVVGTTCSSELELDALAIRLTLQLAKSRPYKITGIAIDGEVGGVEGGESGTPPRPPLCAVPVAPPTPPPHVARAALERSRLTGTPEIAPDADTAKTIAASGKSRIVGEWTLCIDETGAVTKIAMIKSTGFAAYDKTIEAGMHAWTYKPYATDGKPSPVCTGFTFRYAAP